MAHEKSTYATNISRYRKYIYYPFIFFFIIMFLYLSLSKIYVDTYVWQSVNLANIMRSSERGICPVEISIENEMKYSKKNIVILIIYDRTNNQWGDELMKKVVENRLAYSKLHDYTVVDGNDYIDRSRPVAWSKFLAILHYLPTCDYLFYLDMDAVIMQPGVTLSGLISSANSHSACGSSDSCDLILTQDWNGPNTGAMLIRNSPFSMSFLRLAWDLGKQFVPKTTDRGVALPFEYEQRVFHYLLDTKVWRDRPGLPRYRPAAIDASTDVEMVARMTSQDIAARFAYLPQCAMNSYSIHPLDLFTRADPKVSQYAEGDFVIHFAGKKGQVKEDMLSYYLGQASDGTQDR